ncbi:hypothetical protein PRK78_007185 [Emydomyces testavorans]|uniref:Aminoglycoside phosphotransferase domain-containing protein n=1 Tax=Emydomyces testavorans TaxID=2070801 RepID=A0AAF0ILG7_9EURO|nr:hypothetical protein PRK78_007185 [Emydomyces testavorans]
MDQITKHKLDRACQEFIDAIDPLKVCDLVSLFHPEKKACHIFAEWKKGSYNVCIPVIFDNGAGGKGLNENKNKSDNKSEGEKWMVRIPLLPRLAFPEEKMRSEIATMKYVAEKTTIPIPHVYGYSITTDNILGLPFLLIDYIEGNTLYSTNIRALERTQRNHLYAQIGDVYIQLYRQQFDRVGALTLDEHGNWIFANNRPLTIDINEQEVSGLDFCCYLPPDHTFNSTIDYVYMIMRLIFNDFYRGRDCIINQDDAQWYLYSIYTLQSILMEWVHPQYNHGPFVLMHGDLRPPNIVVDDDLNIVSILDWEWSHTVPVQMFVPPSWLTNQGILQISKDISTIGYLAAVYSFIRRTTDQENTFHNPNKLLLKDLPLAALWRPMSEFEEFIIPLGLLAPHCLGNIYWDALDHCYHGQNSKERVQAFFKLDIQAPDRQAVEKKMQEFESFEKERQDLGIERRPLMPTKTAEELSHLAKALKEFREREDKKHKVMPQTIFNSLRECLHRQTKYLKSSICADNLTIEKQQLAKRWLLIGFSTISAMYIISQKLKKTRWLQKLTVSFVEQVDCFFKYS